MRVTFGFHNFLIRFASFSRGADGEGLAELVDSHGALERHFLASANLKNRHVELVGRDTYQSELFPVLHFIG